LNTGADRGLRIESTDNAFIILNGDTDNDGSEVGTAYIGFRQDGTSTVSHILGTIQTAGTNPAGASVTGALANALYLGTGNDNLQFGTNSTIRLTISSTGNITIGQSDTTGSLLIL